MEELTDAQKARHAIREFKTITDALVLRAARAFETARPWPFPDAPRRPAPT